jgi:hypothetical protein
MGCAPLQVLVASAQLAPFSMCSSEAYQSTSMGPDALEERNRICQLLLAEI